MSTVKSKFFIYFCLQLVSCLERIGTNYLNVNNDEYTMEFKDNYIAIDYPTLYPLIHYDFPPSSAPYINSIKTYTDISQSLSKFSHSVKTSDLNILMFRTNLDFVALFMFAVTLIHLISNGHRSKYMSIVIYLILNTVSSSHYTGPVDHSWFQTYYDGLSLIAGSIKKLECGIGDYWATRPIWVDSTNVSFPIFYYSVTVTTEWKTQYKSNLRLTTCCPGQTEFLFRGYPVESIIACGWALGCTIGGVSESEYDAHCGTASLDTIIYLLKEKKGQINLLETSDDIDSSLCTETHKSSIDLQEYPEGSYIIGVAGYAQEYGEFGVQILCEEYSFPVIPSQLDPFSGSNSKLSCNTIISDSFIPYIHMLYFALEISDETYLPITIVVCIQHLVWSSSSHADPQYVSIFKQSSSTLLMEVIDSVTPIWNNTHYTQLDDYDPLQGLRCDTATASYPDPGWDTGVIYIQDPSLYENGEYYLAVQIDEDAGRYLQGNEYDVEIQMSCAPPPTLSPTSMPTINPSQDPTQSPTIEPTNDPTSDPTLIPTIEPTGDPTKDPTTMPTVEPTNNPTISPTNDPTHNPTQYPTVSPTVEPTTDPTPSPTMEYSFPIEKSEFKSAGVSYKNITCGDTLSGEGNMESKLVSYYQFSVTDEMFTPSYITTCPTVTNTNDSIYDTYMYIIRQSDAFVVTQSDSAAYGCNDKSSEIEVSVLPNDNYYAVIQGYNNEFGNFSLRMVCTPPPEKIPKEIVMALVFGTCGFAILLFIIYYIYEWTEYCKRNGLYCYGNEVKSYSAIPTTTHKAVPSNSRAIELTTGTGAVAGTGTVRRGRTSDVSDADDDVDISVEEATCCCVFNAEFAPTRDDAEADEFKAGDPRRIDCDQEFIEQIAWNDDEDAVQLVLAHAIQCCDDGEGLDIYQMLAIRYYDAESRRITSRKPFSKININIEFIAISPFVQTLLMAIVVGLTQTLGITVVIYKIFYAFFEDGITEDICAMESSRWKEVYSLKMLSFLLSLIITFYVSIVMNTIEHSALYEITSRLRAKHMTRIDCVVLWVLQIGQSINWYACLLAVIGSYFIIFEANQGEEEDGLISYSHSGLDMILNAVALFFMLELDETIISAQDYNDCKEHLERIMNSYHSDTTINNAYGHHADDADDDDDADDEEKSDVANYKDWNEQDVVDWIASLHINHQKYKDKLMKFFVEKEINGSNLSKMKRTEVMICGIQDFDDINRIYQNIRIHFKNDNNKSLKYVVPSMSILINIFSVFVKMCCYLSGAVAPFLIFFCW